MKDSTNVKFSVCKCPNRHMLDAGQICEICLGMVQRPDFLDEFPGIVSSNPFDSPYFDDLEQEFRDKDKEQ
jgi:hypothetical protein